MGQSTPTQAMNDRPNMRAYDDKRQKRADRLFHWSLDMPPENDDVDVRVNKGMGWKELAVIAATGLGSAYLFMNQTSAPVQPVAQPPVQVSPADSEYEVRFYDADGKLIEVPHVSSR